MATPVVAAAATLVRQYFLEGFYPTFARVPANAYANVSGAGRGGQMLWFLGLGRRG